MKLPGGENASVDLIKLTGYCLNPDHPRGKHKARIFQSACGFSEENAELLRDQLLEAAERGDANEGMSDAFGRRFVIEYTMQGPGGQSLVRSAWIIRHDEDFPRFVSAYVT